MGESVDEVNIDEPVPVVQALKTAIAGNPKLTYLDLSGIQHLFHWGMYYNEIFQAVEVHEQLRTIIVEDYPPQYQCGDDPFVYPHQLDYTSLERMLFRNHNVTLMDRSGKIWSNGTSVDRLYAMHRLYHGSRSLVKEHSLVLRPLFVASALIQSASNNFQLAGLLLSDHVDTLCELIHHADFEQIAGPTAAVMEEVSSPTSGDVSKICLKRKAELQPSHEAKKALT
ncbi:hypothetical protein FisN_10Lu424 [Fistulifera solaris]|uniref:Uncharacterized protein n=1 Tax=Fistulifera solaris TaxID=1519565 RepID=A0A1Z5JUI1_FISSO|nr:hypothetical protein FisN_10Lu424 [Fistulifera solaris]|eukprot:GAX17705.1 hypothetical protein FisN_10Lu424 [Fistulifera solaris]